MPIRVTIEEPRVLATLGEVHAPAARDWCNAHPDEAKRVAGQLAAVFPLLCPRELAEVLIVRIALIACLAPDRALAALGVG